MQPCSRGSIRCERVLVSPDFVNMENVIFKFKKEDGIVSIEEWPVPSPSVQVVDNETGRFIFRKNNQYGRLNENGNWIEGTHEPVENTSVVVEGKDFSVELFSMLWRGNIFTQQEMDMLWYLRDDRERIWHLLRFSYAWKFRFIYKDSE